jgi:LacI family transcriptional regulator
MPFVSTIEEIAKKAGVSRSTVSRVINDDPNVKDQTRERVMEVVTSHNYVPSRAARKLAGGRTGVIGLVIPIGVSRLFVEPFFPSLIQSVTNRCNTTNRSVMFWLGEPDYERRMINQILGNDLLDGVIVSSLRDEDPIVAALSLSEIPFVLVGRYRNDAKVNFVDIDNQGAARTAVNYLIQIGRKKIATITGVSDMIVSKDRLEGYRLALKKAGIPFDPSLVVDGGFIEDGGYSAMGRLFPQNPDAIFAASDAMAVGAIRFLKEHGKRVPEDVAVIGFDDAPFALGHQPALSTVHQPIAQLGAQAVDLLVELIENNHAEPTNRILSSDLLIRESA